MLMIENVFSSSSYWYPRRDWRKSSCCLLRACLFFWLAGIKLWNKYILGSLLFLSSPHHIILSLLFIISLKAFSRVSNFWRVNFFNLIKSLDKRTIKSPIDNLFEDWWFCRLQWIANKNIKNLLKKYQNLFVAKSIWITISGILMRLE